MPGQRRQTSTAPAEASRRIPALDALRGMALVAMFIYHFCFDLVYFGILKADPYQSIVWIGCRTVILGSFLLLAGASMALAHGDRIHWPAFRRRCLQITGCALLVSIGSHVMFPQSWIWFGVLHMIAVASLLGLGFLRLDWGNLVLGLALVALGTSVKLPAFDAPPLQWLGLMTHKPITEDYVPMLPWFGVVLLGLFLGRRFLAAGLVWLRTWRPSLGVLLLLTLAGRHTLLLYMVHQPVFIGILYLLLKK